MLHRTAVAVVGLLGFLPAAAADPPAEALPFDRDTPAAGLWVGDVAAGSRRGFAVVTITHDEAKGWSAQATALLVMAIEQPVGELRVDGSDVAFRLGNGVNAMRLEGRVTADGQQLAGKASTMQGNAGTFELHRTIRPSSTAAPIPLTGKIQVPDGQTLELTITLGQTPEGRWVGEIAIPQQGLRGFPLMEVDRDGDALTATLKGPPDAIIKAVFSEADTKLTGHMEQVGLVLPLELSRSGEVALQGPKRPQTPAPPFPYQVQDFKVPCPGGHVIAGTLSLPSGAGPHPVAVLISGSGQQDRDETIAGHKPFLVIADYCARRGIAVARYDDRGAGESTGIETVLSATSEDFADDAAAVAAWVRTVEGIDPDRVGLIGHSEGGVIAPMVAGRDAPDGHIAFIVSLAGSAVNGREILLLQTRLLQKAAGIDEESLDRIQAAQATALDLAIQGGDTARLRQATVELSRLQLAAQGRALPDGPEMDMALDAEIQRVTSPWMVYFMTYDPAPALEKLTCPVLALNGTLDLQVWHDQNLPVIEAAAKRGGVRLTVKRYEGLNHLFQPAPTGAFAEYGQIETTFDEQVLADIVEWISTQ